MSSWCSTPTTFAQGLEAAAAAVPIPPCATYRARMPTWVCLLRAVNLGKLNKVSMPLLRDALSATGFTDVRTYVQSGNVVLSSPTRTAATVSARVGSVLRETFELDTPVLVRTPQQLADVAAWNPFGGQAADRPASVHVLHLAEEPDAATRAVLLEGDWGTDRVAARGLEVVFAYGETVTQSSSAAATSPAARLPHAAVAKRLGATGTARNWRTLLALVELSRPG